MKKFEVHHNPAVYAVANGTRGIGIHSDDYFTDDNGYVDEDIEAVRRMDVGSTIQLDGDHHTVLRII